MTTKAYSPLTPAQRSRSLATAIDLLDTPDPAHILALRAANDAHRRRNIRWNVMDDDPTFVPDFTGGRWPEICQSRWSNIPAMRIAVPRVLATQDFVCTRRASHRGRHAAGQGGRIVAVWWSR